MEPCERMNQAVSSTSRRRDSGRVLLSAVVLVGLACGGCASNKPLPVFEVPTDAVTVQGVLSAGSDTNPDPTGRPAPVLIRLYELASDDPFKRLDFFSLFDHEPAVLGASLLRVREFPMVPGQVVDVSGQLDPRTQFFGAIAAVRDLDRAPWRVVIPRPTKTVRPSEPQRLGMNIMVGAAGVALYVAEIPAGQAPAMSLSPTIPGLAVPAAPGFSAPGVTPPALPGVNTPVVAPIPGVTAPLVPGLAAPAVPGVAMPGTAPTGVPVVPAAPVLATPAVPGLTAPLVPPVPGVTAPVLPTTPQPVGLPVSPFAPTVPGARPAVPVYDPR